MESFVLSRPSRVVFGAGRLATLPDEVKRLGAQRALVLTTPEQRPLGERVATLLGACSAGVYSQAVMHVPVEVAQAARDEAGRLGADCYVAVGGGSTIGLGKAIALVSGQPIIAVPTTYAGSEVTPIYAPQGPAGTTIAAATGSPGERADRTPLRPTATRARPADS